MTFGCKAFIEPSTRKKMEFRGAFLGSDEFRLEELRQLRTDGMPNPKEELARAIAESRDPSTSDKRAVLVLARRPRAYLAIRTGEPEETPPMGDATELMTGAATPDRWYGPIDDPDEDVVYYLYYRQFEHWYPDPDWEPETEEEDKAGPPRLKGTARWLITARVHARYVAFMWDNFTRAESEDTTVQSSHAYWQHLGNPVSRLLSLLRPKKKFKSPNLSKLTLKTMWDKYTDDTDWRWEHLWIRAEEDRVKLNARTSRTVEGDGAIELKGLEKLADRLALSAMQALGKIPEGKLRIEDIASFDRKLKKTQRRLRNRILRTLIKDWGPNSYEFLLRQEKGANEEGTLHAHFYFGTLPNSGTKDAIRHIRCLNPKAPKPPDEEGKKRKRRKKTDRTLPYHLVQASNHTLRLLLPELGIE